MKPFAHSLLLSGLCALMTSAQAQQWEALPPQPPVPVDNPQTPEKIELGKTLFFDPRLSEHGTLSCNSCHNVMAAGDDNRPHSIGMHDARGARGAPTVWNAAYQSVQFWDGRADTLEAQAKGPIVNPIEPDADFGPELDTVPLDVGEHPLDTAQPGALFPLFGPHLAQLLADRAQVFEHKICRVVSHVSYIAIGVGRRNYRGADRLAPTLSPLSPSCH